MLVLTASIDPDPDPYNVFTPLTQITLICMTILAFCAILSNSVVVITLTKPIWRTWTWTWTCTAKHEQPITYTLTQTHITTTHITIKQQPQSPGMRRSIDVVSAVQVTDTSPLVTSPQPQRATRFPVMTFLIVCQSLIDLICMIVLFVLCTLHLSYGTWPNGSKGWMCQINGIINVIGGGMSIFNLVLISYERRRSIVSGRPLGMRDAIRLHLVGWVLAIPLAVMPYMSSNRRIGQYVIHPSATECYMASGQYIQPILTLAVYAVGLVPSMFINYYLVYRKVKYTFQDIINMVSPQQHRTIKNQQQQVALLMVIFTCLMLFCWCPLDLVFIVMLFDYEMPEGFIVFSIIMAVVSFVINPIVYGMYDRDVKANLRRAFLPCLSTSITVMPHHSMTHTSRALSQTAPPAPAPAASPAPVIAKLSPTATPSHVPAAAATAVPVPEPVTGGCVELNSEPHAS